MTLIRIFQCDRCHRTTPPANTGRELPDEWTTVQHTGNVNGIRNVTIEGHYCPACSDLPTVDMIAAANEHIAQANRDAWESLTDRANARPPWEAPPGWTDPFATHDDTRPHSRACGMRPHPHGEACSFNCPTCHGQPIL